MPRSGLRAARVALAALAVLAATVLAPSPLRSQSGERRLSFAGNYRVTLYWVALETARQAGGGAKVPILDANGGVLAWVHPWFKREIDIEGTGRLRDGRTVNFHKRVGGTKRFVVTNARYGLAADGRELMPFRSAAADRAVIAPGTILYVPLLDGLRFSDGSIHDGYIMAHDTGEAIAGKRLDLFITYEPFEALFESRGITIRSGIPVYRVDPPAPPDPRSDIR